MEARQDPAETAPFRLDRPVRQTVPFLFASPHSGRRYPASLLERSRLDATTLRRSEDAFVDELFAGGIDLVLTPTASIPAPRADDSGDVIETTRLMTHLTYAWSLAGIPAVSVPCGFTQAGLPVGVQLIGRYADEATLLRVAAQLEADAPWSGLRPPVS